MKPLKKIILTALAAVLVVPAWAELKVATSLSDLASVAEEVGGEYVSVVSLCKGYQDPHFVPAKPSLMKAIQDADVFVSVGMELDGGWLPLVLPGSRNARIQPGRPGFVDASEGIPVLEKPTGTVTRAEGDVHPMGNPHYYMNPKNLKIVADHLAEVFSGLDPDHASDYKANARKFGAKIDKSMAAWKKKLGPYRGKAVVVYHKNFEYFIDSFGLKLFGTVEPKPGIPPNPRYLSETASAMKNAGVKVVLYQPYHMADAAKQLAKKAGGKAFEVPTEVGGVPGTGDVFSKFDFIVGTIIKAFSGK
jgi:zinc/manganese transport system substrate-binding protein